MILAMPKLSSEHGYLETSDRATSVQIPGAPHYPGVVVEHDVEIVMRDGVRLYADVHRPADAKGRSVEEAFPVVIVLTPYNKWLQRGVLDSTLDKNFVRHGYVQVVVDVRGTGSSFGTWKMWDVDEQRDSLEIAKWVREQPFCNGKLGLYGPSYLGIAALLAAGKRPEGLGAVFVIASAEDVYRDLFRGGDVPFLICLGLFTLIKLLGLAPPRYLLRHPWRSFKLLGCRISGFGWSVRAALSLLRDGELAYDGPFFRERSPGSVAGRIDAPTFLISGWFDIYQRGTPRLYNELQLPPGQKQLLMGPWYHVTVGRGLGNESSPPSVQTLALMWFDRWLKGTENNIELYGPVTSYQIGSGRWVHHASFPPDDNNCTRLHLGPDGRLHRNVPQNDGTDRRRAGLFGGWLTRSSTQWSAGALRLGPWEHDNRFIESRSFVYTTECFEQTSCISGPLSLTLWCATTGNDANWIVSLSDVDPSGRSMRITGGALVQSMRALDARRCRSAPGGDVILPFHRFTSESRLPVVPGEPTKVTIEILNIDAVITEGHRLRLAITSSDFPTLWPTPSRMCGRRGTLCVHYGPAKSSFLSIPLTPYEETPVEHPIVGIAGRHRKRQ